MNPEIRNLRDVAHEERLKQRELSLLRNRAFSGSPQTLNVYKLHWGPLEAGGSGEKRK